MKYYLIDEEHNVSTIEVTERGGTFTYATGYKTRVSIDDNGEMLIAAGDRMFKGSMTLLSELAAIHRCLVDANTGLFNKELITKDLVK